MCLFFSLAILFLFSSPHFADISKLRIYPSGISVSFMASAYVPEPSKKKSRWGRRKKKVEKVLPAPIVEFSQFIRVINGLKMPKHYQASIIFYDEKDLVISYQTITNTSKPSPQHIFYMDRQTGSKFKGFLDIYNIPENAQYFQLSIIDQKQTVIVSATHPYFDENNKIQIQNYRKISPRQPSMLQIEAYGDKQNIFTRAGVFYFTQ